jgi:hypothetical protein
MFHFVRRDCQPSGNAGGRGPTQADILIGLTADESGPF